MKKQVVAVMLSLAMCASTGAEASIVSAAEFSSEVSADEETGEALAADDSEATDDSSVVVESDDTVQADENADTGADTSADADTSSDANASEAADENADVDFSSGDEEEQPAVGIQTEENAAEEAGTSVKETAGEHEASLLYTKWTQVNGKWKLKKLATASAKAQAAGISENETPVVGEEAADESAAAENATGDIEPAGTEAVSDAEAQQSVDGEAEVVSEQADADQVTVDEQTAEEAGAASTYYTSADGLVKITTLNKDGKTLFSGSYAFDKDGYMITGRSQVGDNSADYYYFLTDSEVSVSNALSADIKTPYNSNLGQMITNEWRWNSNEGVFNYYAPKQENITANKTYSIGGETYYLLSGGKPYVGDKTISGSVYCFRAAASAQDIPGKMARNMWVSRKVGNRTQWRYFDSNGRYQKKGTGAYKVLSDSSNLYLLDANGYLITNKKMTKGADKYWYLADGSGVVYRNKLVKYGKYRYYFVDNGRRATWKKRWVKLSGAGNRYYYFGSVAGRVQEQKGIKKVTVNGKFVGWFYFSAAGNSFLNTWKSGRYYLADGRMASGVTKINGKYYFFQRSSSKAYKGKVYKGKWIKYNSKYYYASGSGVLAENGWKRIKSDGRFYYFYFKNCTAVTNKTGVTCNGNKGSLDGRGRFVSAGWVVVNNNRNYVRYMDPKTGKYVKNTVRWIDGMQYRFNSKGYRVNDRTSEFKQSSYYLACDRVNGVMTVYTNSSMKIPIKTIRVSVGKAETPTRLGTYTLTRSDRWQLLMGPSWGQYGTHVTGGIYVHSVACSEKNDHNLPVGEYYKLGNPASHGCIRCCVADAKWVYDNCNGSKIYIFDGKYTSDEAFKGPLGRKAITALRGAKNFDPTDPAYN